VSLPADSEHTNVLEGQETKKKQKQTGTELKMNGNYAPSANVNPGNSYLDLPAGQKSPPPSTYYPSSSGPPESSSYSVPSYSANPDVYSMKSPPTNVPPSGAAIKNPLASLQSAKRKRLPQDKVGQLEDRIALDPRDADAWLALIKEHQAKGKIADARETYERFLRVFPDLVLNTPAHQNPSLIVFVLTYVCGRPLSGEIMPIWN